MKEKTRKVIREKAKKPLSQYTWEAHIEDNQIRIVRSIYKKDYMINPILPTLSLRKGKEREYLRQLRDFIDRLLKEY